MRTGRLEDRLSSESSLSLFARRMQQAHLAVDRGDDVAAGYCFAVQWSAAHNAVDHQSHEHQSYLRTRTDILITLHDAVSKSASALHVCSAACIACWHTLHRASDSCSRPIALSSPPSTLELEGCRNASAEGRPQPRRRRSSQARPQDFPAVIIKFIRGESGKHG